MATPPENPGFAKAVLIVFFLVWTLASATMTAAFLGVVRLVPAEFGSLSVVPRLFAVIPLGFTLIGIMVLYRAVTSRSFPQSPHTTASRQVAESAPTAPPVAASPSCPGCGSRKNLPGATICAHCGGVLAH